MMSQTSKRELMAAVRPRYTLGNRAQKRQVLDELVAATGYHRKYAIQLLNHPPAGHKRPRRARRVTYDGRVRAALEQLWWAATGTCSKRLVPVLAEYIDALERHKEQDLDAETRARLLTLSPARGLFVFSPVFLLCIYGVYLKVRGFRADRQDILLDALLLLAIVLHGLAVSSFPHWWAGYSFCPRFLTDMTPYLVYFLIPVNPAIVAWKRGLRPRLVVRLAVLGVLALASLWLH